MTQTYLKNGKCLENGTNASYDYSRSKIKYQKNGQNAFIKTLWYSKMLTIRFIKDSQSFNDLSVS